MADSKQLIDLSKYLPSIDGAQTIRVRGRVTELTGIIVKAVVPGVKMGDVCLVQSASGKEPVKAEVVGFRGDEVFLMPLGDMEGIGPESEVIPTGESLTVGVGPQLLGRVLNALGQPMDAATKGDLRTAARYPVHADPPDPLTRKRVTKVLPVGVRSIDGLLTVGEGQRIGFFAAAGVGKSTLLGMIARNSSADVIVIGLIGERGREVNDFLEQDLKEEGLARSVVVVATSDTPSLLRLKAAYTATAIAEYFRDQGKKVMLLMDSITRFARAQREIGLAIGEPPARQGYTPSVFSTLPKLLERSGNSDKGSITAFYTVLVAGDDMNEPVADEVRSILDGHIVLSRELAAKGHYPAIDIPESISRVMDNIIVQPHLDAARKLREVISTYDKEKDLILIGAYEEGADPRVDYAIQKIDAVNNYLKQKVAEKFTFDQTVAQLKAVFG
jgi:flagellar protein export ATPase FliI